MTPASKNRAMNKESTLCALLSTKTFENRGRCTNSCQHGNRKRAQVTLAWMYELEKGKTKHSAIKTSKKSKVPQNYT